MPGDLKGRVLAALDFGSFYQEQGVQWRGPANRDNWRLARCPFHDDNGPSLSVNMGHGGWKCFGACNESGDAFDFYQRRHGVEFREALEAMASRLGIPSTNGRPPGDDDPTTANEALIEQRRPERQPGPIDPDIPASYHNALLGNPERLEWLHTERGLSLETVREHGIGIVGDRFTIPVWDEAGQVVNIRMYKPGATQNKMLSWRSGFGEARLFPVAALADSAPPVLITEGELDCLLARQHGFNAITATGGAGTWLPAWAVWFRGRKVAICYDCDEAGRTGAATVARKLAGVAEEVRVVDLGLEDGEDITDAFVRYRWTREQLQARIDAAPVWAAEGLAEEEGAAPDVIRTMREVLETAGEESLPVALVPRLAYAGRAVLFAGREKSGKSTLLSAGVAAATRGQVFLVEPCRAVTALWLTAEEREDDVARRLEKFGADPDRVWIVAAPKLPHVLNDLREGVERLRPDVVVVDTLASLVRLLPRDERPAPGDSTAWTPVVLSLVELAHQIGAAVVIVGHASKATGEYRDSTAIGASVDAILEMKDGSTSHERKLSVRGRWALEDFSVRLVGQEFELVAGTLPLPSRVLQFITENPGCSARQLREGVRGHRVSEVNAARDGLLAAGLIADHGEGGGGMQLWLVPRGGNQAPSEGAGNHFGNHLSDRVVPVVPSQGTATGTTSNDSAEPGWFPSGQPLEGAGGNHGPGDGTTTSPEPPDFLCEAGCGQAVGSKGITCAACRYGARTEVET